MGKKEQTILTYAVLDEQRNTSLAKTEFELFGINSVPEPYALKMCSGVIETLGNQARNYVLESMDGNAQIPTLIKCDMLPDDKSEIPSLDIARYYKHLKPVVDKIPTLDLLPQVW